MAEISNIRTGESPTASRAIIAESVKTVFVTTPSGRSIEVKRPTHVTRRNARKAISAESQTKPELFGEYLLVFLIASIDGAPLATPTNEQQADAVQDRIGDEGLSAVLKAVVDHFAAGEGDAVADAKNS